MTYGRVIRCSPRQAASALVDVLRSLGGFWWCHSLLLGTAIQAVAVPSAATRLLQALLLSTGGIDDEHADDA